MPVSSFEPTLVTMSELALRSFSGYVRAIYGVGGDDMQVEYRHASAPLPNGESIPPNVENRVRMALTGTADEIATAARILRNTDIAPIARVYEALTLLVHKARLARVLTGRTEPAARRVLADLAQRAVDSNDVWASEIRELGRACATGEAPNVPERSSEPTLDPSGLPGNWPAIIGWVVHHSTPGDEGIGRARTAVKLAHLPHYVEVYEKLESLHEKCSLVLALVGRPRIEGAPPVQALIADLLRRDLSLEPDDTRHVLEKARR